MEIAPSSIWSSGFQLYDVTTLDEMMLFDRPRFIGYHRYVSWGDGWFGYTNSRRRIKESLQQAAQTPLFSIYILPEMGIVLLGIQTWESSAEKDKPSHAATFQRYNGVSQDKRYLIRQVHPRPQKYQEHADLHANRKAIVPRSTRRLCLKSCWENWRRTKTSCRLRIRWLHPRRRDLQETQVETTLKQLKNTL